MMMKILRLLASAFALAFPLALRAAQTAMPTTRRASAFFPATVLEGIRANAREGDWGRALRDEAIEQARPWREMSDEQLWKLMFGATIPRSWHVLSNGVCPACHQPVPMYDWQIDAIARPWKVRCPHCQQQFPTNDFKKFYDSGLDVHGVFDPAKADRSLLFNAAHPDARDPLRMFGVEDGTGYVEHDQRWRFISTYLVFGQWKQAVHLGIKRLATAWLLTGEAQYAHKAAILLDRVADVYPTFDFKTQGLLYESAHGDGYVSVWHDATIETREMALAYDAIKPGFLQDEQLARFLSDKSERFQTPNRKHSAGDVAANIEQRILNDALEHPHKIYSNYPQQYLTSAMILTALNWPANREQVFALLDPVIEKTTSVDGTTGEKGMANYSCYAAQRTAEFLGYYARMDDQFLPEMVKRHPRLPQMWRFFIDTWCANQKYYPLTGDTMHVAAPVDDYVGVAFLKDHGISATGHMSGVIAPSMYSFLWQLYEITKDPAFAQVIYKANDAKSDGLPYDLFVGDPAAFGRQLKSVIDEHGAKLQLSSINKQQWHLGILRSGKGDASRAAWLDYDAGGNHGHLDGLNLGLFARGLDLMPDLGYPPVQFGGWGSQRAQWYTTTAAHNTVLVNGAQQSSAAGKTTLWAPGDGFSAMSASAPGLNSGITSTFERTIALADVSPEDSYLLDIFRVAGGSDHIKSFFSHFGTIETPGLSMEPASDFAHPQMRNVKVARNPRPGWLVNWTIEDRYKLLPPGADVRLRYTDYTRGADAYTCEAWAVAGEFNSMDGVWMPRVLVRHRAAPPDAPGTAVAPGKSVAPPTTSNEAPLETTFVSLIEPYDATIGPLIKSSRRLALRGGDGESSDRSVALEIDLADGRRDLWISNPDPAPVSQADAGIVTDARLALVRREAHGRPVMISLCAGSSLSAPGVKVRLSAPAAFAQLRLDEDGSVTLAAGKGEQVASIEVNGKAVKLQPAK
jgi:hypothetical protein